MISVADAKAHLNISTDADDTLLQAMINAAVESVGDYTGRVMTSATFTEVFDGFSEEMLLPKAPLVSVSSVTYQDAGGNEQTLAGSGYKVDSRRALARVVRAHGTSWPATLAGDQQTVTVTYTAGYTDEDSPNTQPAPDALKHAALMIVGSLYDMRENHAIGTVGEVPVSAQFLMAPHRILL